MADFDQFPDHGYGRSGFINHEEHKRERMEQILRLHGANLGIGDKQAVSPNPEPATSPAPIFEPVGYLIEHGIKTSVDRMIGHPRFERLTINDHGEIETWWLVDGERHANRKKAEERLAVVEDAGRFTIGSRAWDALLTGGVKWYEPPTNITIGDEDVT